MTARDTKKPCQKPGCMYLSSKELYSPLRSLAAVAAIWGEGVIGHYKPVLALVFKSRSHNAATDHTRPENQIRKRPRRTALEVIGLSTYGAHVTTCWGFFLKSAVHTQ